MCEDAHRGMKSVRSETTKSGMIMPPDTHYKPWVMVDVAEETGSCVPSVGARPDYPKLEPVEKSKCENEKSAADAENHSKCTWHVAGFYVTHIALGESP